MRRRGRSRLSRRTCPRLIGRGAEWSALTAALDGASDGRGACLLIVGEPGIGKSRLVAEAIREAERRDMWVLSGRASPIGAAVPYQSVSAALVHGLRSRPLPDPPDRHALRAGLATLAPGLVDGPAVSQSPVLLGETLLRLAAAAGGEAGTVIVLDDLQWACGDTLAIVEYLADNAAFVPVVVIATLRPEGAALALADALERRRSANVLTLGRLDAMAVHEMAASCLGDDGREPPAALVELLSGQSDGLPFLVEELLTGLLERGALIRAPDGWTLEAGARVDVPLSFAQTVRDRLAALSLPQRQVLETAALLGRDFDWADLPRLTDLAEADVLHAMSAAREAGLVREAAGQRFRFRHALTVDAILRQMLASQRARLAARTLNALSGESGPPAEKFELAAHLAVQAGRRAEASRYLTEEADRALSSGAMATAVATARRARSLVSADEPESLAADEVLLAAVSRAGDADTANEVGRALVSRLDARDALPDRRVRARLLLAKAARASLDSSRARALCEEALALRPADPWLQVALRLMLAEIALARGEHEAAVVNAEAALDAADAAGFDELACDALMLLGRYRLLVTLERGRAERCFHEAMRRAERAGLPLYRLRIMLETAWLDLGRPGQSASLEEARTKAGELGALALEAELEHVLAVSYLADGDLDAAAGCASRALESARRYRLEGLAAAGAGVQAAIEAALGHRARAEQQVEHALATGDHAPSFKGAISGTALVLAALADDDLSAAAQRAAETKTALLPEGMRFEPPFLGMFYALAAVAQAAAGATELIERRDWIKTGAAFPHASFCIARAIAAGRAGNANEAKALFAAGDDGLSHTPWFRALYRRYAAEAALTDGWGAPAAWLAEAEHQFEQVGDDTLARACRSLLRLTGSSPRRRRSSERDEGAGALTTREADVLALLAEGLTNKRIAARLYLSPRTVEKHVERILTKTGQSNRTALAATAAHWRPAVSAA